MTLLPNTITWGVPGRASINHADMICFALFTGCLPFNPTSKMERVKKMGVAKASFVSCFFFFFHAKSYSVWGYRCWIQKGFVSFKLVKQMADCANPISVRCYAFHIYNYGCNAVSQGTAPLCIRCKNQNTYCLKLD